MGGVIALILLIGLGYAVVVGGIIGWLAGLLPGFGFGLWRNIVTGIIGALIGLLTISSVPFLEHLIPDGVIGWVLPCAIGAIVLLVIVEEIARLAGRKPHHA